MIKYILLIIILSTNAMADSKFEIIYPEEHELHLECEYLGDQIYRCENKEVLCYKFNGYRSGGMSCKFKRKENEVRNTNKK